MYQLAMGMPWPSTDVFSFLITLYCQFTCVAKSIQNWSRL